MCIKRTFCIQVSHLQPCCIITFSTIFIAKILKFVGPVLKDFRFWQSKKKVWCHFALLLMIWSRRTTGPLTNTYMYRTLKYYYNYNLQKHKGVTQHRNVHVIHGIQMYHHHKVPVIVSEGVGAKSYCCN